MLNKNERKGKLDQVTGHIKEAVGAVTGNRALKAEGKADVAVGKLEETVGKVEATIGHIEKKTADTLAGIGKSTTH